MLQFFLNETEVFEMRNVKTSRVKLTVLNCFETVLFQFHFVVRTVLGVRKMKHHNKQLFNLVFAKESL